MRAHRVLRDAYAVQWKPLIEELHKSAVALATVAEDHNGVIYVPRFVQSMQECVERLDLALIARQLITAAECVD